MNPMNPMNEIKILIVDDIPQNMEIVIKALEKDGYDLYIANNGFMALELISKVKLDLILLDIMMPEMDGFETLSRIKDLDQQNEILVIFISGKVEVENINKGYDLGAIDYIRKPFNILELKTRIKQQAERILEKRHNR